jgi:hypothetical protein
MFISKANFCGKSSADIHTLFMPLYTSRLDEQRFDIVKNNNNKRLDLLDMIEETLVVKQPTANQSGAYVCISGHAESVRYNIFYVDIAEETPLLSKNLTAYHYAAFGFVFSSLLVIILVALFVSFNKILKSTRSYSDYTNSSDKVEHGKFIDSKFNPLGGQNRSMHATCVDSLSQKTTPDNSKKLVFLQNNLIYSDLFKVENVVDKGKI